MAATITTFLGENTTPITKDVLEKLIKFTTECVNKAMRHKLSKMQFDYSIKVNAYKTKNQYKGRFYTGANRTNIFTNFSSKNYPCSARYARYKDMPKETFNDWIEAFVGVLAHELGHVFFSGRKDGEFSCELLMSDVLTMYRKKPVKLGNLKIKKKFGPNRVQGSTLELRKIIKERKLTKSPKFAGDNFYLDTEKGYTFINSNNEDIGCAIWCEDSTLIW